MTSNALAMSQGTQSALSLVQPVANPLEMIAFHKSVTAIVEQVLVEGTDYGTIQGTDKPTLLKPGAERLCIAFGASPEFELVKSEVDHDKRFTWQKKHKRWNKEAKKPYFETEEGESLGLYRYIYRCRVVRGDGRKLGEGDGVCSTMESKYVDRPRDCENTALQMAQKRAFVKAVLHAFGLTGRFGAAEPGEPVEDVQLYTGTESQVRFVDNYLREAGLAESLWPTVKTRMRGKPSSALDTVLAEVRAVAAEKT